MCVHEKGRDPLDCSQCRRDSEAMKRHGDDDYIPERDDKNAHDPNERSN